MRSHPTCGERSITYHASLVLSARYGPAFTGFTTGAARGPEREAPSLDGAVRIPSPIDHSSPKHGATGPRTGSTCHTDRFVAPGRLALDTARFIRRGQPLVLVGVVHG